MASRAALLQLLQMAAGAVVLGDLGGSAGATSAPNAAGNATYESGPHSPEFVEDDEDQDVLQPPDGHREGPMPTISDSLFSLIILIYVSVIFTFMFFAFCWKEPDPPPPDPAHKNIPMITSILEEMEKQMMVQREAEAKDADEGAPDDEDSCGSPFVQGPHRRDLRGSPAHRGRGFEEATEMTEMRTAAAEGAPSDEEAARKNPLVIVDVVSEHHRVPNPVPAPPGNDSGCPWSGTGLPPAYLPDQQV